MDIYKKKRLVHRSLHFTLISTQRVAIIQPSFLARAQKKRFFGCVENRVPNFKKVNVRVFLKISLFFFTF